MCLHMYLSCYSHWRSFISIRSSRVRRTTNITQVTRKPLTLALSKNTCHTAALFPQHGFSQVDLRGQEWGRRHERGRACRSPADLQGQEWGRRHERGRAHRNPALRSRPRPTTSHLPRSAPSSRALGRRTKTGNISLRDAASFTG